MAENPFRILLDFRELNFKFYKFVWMSVSPRDLVTINDLKDAILKKFSFQRTDVQLFLRDGLLPEDENIANILRENDSVRLFYAEPSNSNLNDSRAINYDGSEPSTADDQGTSSKKRRTHSDESFNLEDNEQVKSNKKRKQSFSNGTYLFENNNTLEYFASMKDVPDNVENFISFERQTENNLENQHKSCKIKKKLTFTDEVLPNSLVSENETFLPSEIIPRSEKNESRINSCKKKKKHKHSKDASKNEVIFHDNMSEINKNDPSFHKNKKKPKHSHGTSKAAVSFCNEILTTAEKLDDNVNKLESLNNELSELKESIFETVADDSEFLKPASVSFCASSVNTSSGIGSLKSSEENNEKISPNKNCSKSYVSDAKSVSTLEGNNLPDQGNNCKKKKRKRHRKRKSLLINPQIEMSNDWNLDEFPPKFETLDSSFSSTYKTAEMSCINKETSDRSISDGYLSGRSSNILEKSIFLEGFSNYVPNTSTPFSNVITNIPGSSNCSQNQSNLVSYENATQKKMGEEEERDLRGLKNGNSLSTNSLPLSATKNKATVSSHNFNEKKLSTKMNGSSEKSTDSFSNKEVKSRVLGPDFSYRNCPALNSCPLAGTRIAYKVLELDSTYSPVVSNYKEGLVKSVNSQTDELEIELIEPEVKEVKTGKFENLYEQELPPPPEVIEKVTLNWLNLIDPVRVLCE